MPVNPEALRHSYPDACRTALLLIDVINDLDFDGGERLLETALPTADRILALKQRARDAGIPTIYVNDNFGRWRSDFREIVDHCLHDGVPGRPLAEKLHPEEDDYFVLKPLHSGFYSTNLDTLLQHLGAQTLILTGFSGDICVLFTANDAYMRNFDLYVPSDCLASEEVAENEHTLRYMERVLKVDTTPSHALDLGRLQALEA